jgi:hypothetical protein
MYRPTAFLLTVLMATPAFATQRFIGWFNGGEPINVTVDGPITRPVSVMRAGHTVQLWPSLPDAALSRLAMANPTELVSIRALKGKKVYSAEETAFIRTLVDPRFDESMKTLINDGVIRKVKVVAARFGVDPAVLVASLLGELTFNNDLERSGQDKAGRWLPAALNFGGAARVSEALSSPAFADCHPELSDYWSWVCINQIWNTSISKAKKDPATDKIPDSALISLAPTEKALHEVLRPRTGGSYGLAQMSLVRALMVSRDVTNRAPQYPQVRVGDMRKVMAMVLDDDATLNILAASAARCLMIYKRFGGIDITHNLGVQATLFNLGYEFEKATTLTNKNAYNASRGLPAISPQENYLGWYLTERESDIRRMLN